MVRSEKETIDMKFVLRESLITVLLAKYFVISKKNCNKIGSLFFKMPCILSKILIIRGSHKQLPQSSKEVIRIGIANLYFKNKERDSISNTLNKANFDILVSLEWTGHNLDLSTLAKSGYKTILNVQRQGTHGICVIAKENMNIQSSLIRSPVKDPCRIPLSISRFSWMDKKISLVGVHALLLLHHAKKQLHQL
ncbi:MAG: hypothetical protein GY760_24150 [Deltaproteobacteria bacterium]|nr:hypothetical protein [Deltaproteobacteria bacterium]